MRSSSRTETGPTISLTGNVHNGGSCDDKMWFWSSLVRFGEDHTIMHLN